jgi:hypothetical protein
MIIIGNVIGTSPDKQTTSGDAIDVFIFAEMIKQEVKSFTCICNIINQ